MSFRLVTTPWLTKNLAGGGWDETHSSGARAGWEGTLGWSRQTTPASRRPRQSAANRLGMGAESGRV